VDALIASLPTTKSITGRYGAESAAAGGMAKSLSDHLAQSQLARVGFAAGAPNIFAQSVQSATAPAAGVIGPQTAGAGQGLIAAMAANTANSMAGAPGAATAQGNIAMGAIGRRQTDALNDRAQQATAIRLKLPELTDASLADSRDASYKAWAANENAWMARAQMAQQGNQFNAREANDAAAANAGLAQDTWQTGFTQANQNARTQAQIDAANARAAAALDKNKDGRVSSAEKAAGAQKKIIDAGLKQVEKWRSETTSTPGREGTQWIYRKLKPPTYQNQPPEYEYIHEDAPLPGAESSGYELMQPGTPAGEETTSPRYTQTALFNQLVRYMVSRGISQKRARNVAQRYLDFTPLPPAPPAQPGVGPHSG
jgi:hypothetical protein